MMLGHIPNLSNEDYHAADGTSKSKLDAIHVSQLNYWDKYINPKREPQEEISSFILGSAIHSLVLEPHLFEQNYVMGFDKSQHPLALDTMDDMKAHLVKNGLKTSGSKSELISRLMDIGYSSDQFILNLERDYAQSCGDKIILPAADYKNMQLSLDALNKHHTAAALIKDALVEQSFFVEDEYGLIRKCRPDAITKNGKVWLDLKSTNDVSATGFGRTISKFRYLVQAAWYMDIAHMALGSDAPDIFAFIAVQKQRPYDVAVHVVTEEQLEWGRIVYQRDYTVLRSCLESNVWHGADGGNILEVQLPKWDMQYLEES